MADYDPWEGVPWEARPPKNGIYDAAYMKKDFQEHLLSSRGRELMAQIAEMPESEILAGYPCPFCGSAVERSRIGPTIICTGCRWEFVPPRPTEGYGGHGVRPEQVIEAWLKARER